MPLNPPENIPLEGCGSFEGLFHLINVQAKEQSYSIIKRRPSNYKDGVPRRYDLACVAGGVVKASTSTGQRRATSKKTHCPWKAKAVRSKTGPRWFFELQDGAHNHGPIEPRVKRTTRAQRAALAAQQELEADTVPAIIDSEMSIMGEGPSSTPTVLGQPSSMTQTLPGEQHGEAQRQLHTRVMAACDACRVSKTRCDATRPECAKCTERGRPCVYPDNDPSSM